MPEKYSTRMIAVLNGKLSDSLVEQVSIYWKIGEQVVGLSVSMSQRQMAEDSAVSQSTLSRGKTVFEIGTEGDARVAMTRYMAEVKKPTLMGFIDSLKKTEPKKTKKMTFADKVERQAQGMTKAQIKAAIKRLEALV